MCDMDLFIFFACLSTFLRASSYIPWEPVLMYREVHNVTSCSECTIYRISIVSPLCS